MSIIEPGYFMTGIIDIERLTQGLHSRFSMADKEVQQFYGTSYRDESKTL